MTTQTEQPPSLDEDPTAWFEAKIAEYATVMMDWTEGRRSYTNFGPNAPYTPDVIARMDAAEVQKHAAAIEGLLAITMASKRVRRR